MDRRKNNVMKKVALLSLSFLLITHTSIAAILPTLYQYYGDKSVSQVDMIVSIPSFMVIVVILVNIAFSRYLKERVLIITGLLLVLAGGMAPLFVQEYSIVLLSRALLGIGLGCVNVRAISMISERYEGNERASLLGFRSAIENVGNALMLFAVGRLLLTGWTHVFLIYAEAAPILFLYLMFMPKEEVLPFEKQEETTFGTKKGGFTAKQLRKVFALVLFGYFTIAVSSTCNIRLSVLAVEKGFGTESQASVIMSLLMLIGIVAGLIFGSVRKKLGKHFLTVLLLFCGVGLVIIAFSESLFMAGFGAIQVGLAYTMMVSFVFLRVSDAVPTHLVDSATSMVLVGCNLGAATCPFLMKAISLLGDSAMIPFLVFALISGVCAVWSVVRRKFV